MSYKGTKLSKETIQKMSEIKMGSKNPMYGQIPWNKGTKGIMKSNKASFKKGQIPWNKGIQIDRKRFPKMGHFKKHTKSSNRKNRLAHIGKKHSIEARLKMSRTRKNLIGKLAPRWKGGVYQCNGYILVHKPNHPFCNKRGYIMEHRLVMEKHIKRFLKPEEEVHHINNNHADNRIENLKLFANKSEHNKYHYPKGKPVA